MLRRTVFVATCVFAFVAIGTGAPRSQWPDDAVFLAGWVHMGTSLDGMTTTVTVTTTQPGAEGQEERVVSSFRAQHASRQFLEHEGRAAVVFESTRLTVLSDDGTAWQFILAAPVAVGVSSGTELRQFPVVGLSRHRSRPADEDLGSLSVSPLVDACSAAALGGDPAGGCSTCESGGEGVLSCGAKCAGIDQCSVTCAPGYHACCNCPDDCRCCSDQVDAATVTYRDGR